MSAAEPEHTVPHPAPAPYPGGLAPPGTSARPARTDSDPSQAQPGAVPARGRARTPGSAAGRGAQGAATTKVPGPAGGGVGRSAASGPTPPPLARTTVPPRLRRPARAGGSTRLRRSTDAPKQHLPRLSRTRLLVLAAGLLVLLGVAAYAVFFSSWLVLDTVKVEGNTTVSTAEVLGTAALELGEPLARVDTGAAADRVAALLPIASVELHRAWPGTLVISVTERRPALAIADAGGYSVLDAEGLAFRHEDTAPAGVPLLRTTGSTPVDAAGRDAVLAVVPHLPAAVRARVLDISAATFDSITLNLTDGVTVVWGSAEDSARKAQVLTELMRNPATAYNVSAPDVPAIRPLPTSDS